MDALLEKIESEQPTVLPARSSATDVLSELRKMNKNNIDFYHALLEEIKDLKTDRAADQTRLTKLETDALNHKSEVDEKLKGHEQRFVSQDALINSLQRENTEQGAKIKLLENDMTEQKEKTLELECRSRKRNLIFGKVTEERGINSKESYEQVHAKVINILENKLGIIGARNMLFRNIHRLGRREEHHTRPRNVIVAFLCQTDVDKVLQAAREVKSPDVSIRTDLPRELNEMRNALLGIKKEYRDRDQNPVRCKLAYIKFRPVLFRPVPGGDDQEVIIERGQDGKFHEINHVH